MTLQLPRERPQPGTVAEMIAEVTRPVTDTLSRSQEVDDHAGPTVLRYAPPPAQPAAPTVLPTATREDSMSEEIYLATQAQVDALVDQVGKEVAALYPGASDDVEMSPKDRHNFLMVALLTRGVDEATYFAVKAKAMLQVKDELRQEAERVRALIQRLVEDPEADISHAPAFALVKDQAGPLTARDALEGYLSAVETAMAAAQDSFDMTLLDLRSWMEREKRDTLLSSAASKLKHDSMLSVIRNVGEWV